VTGMFIAPTILADKSEVLRGDNVVLFGQSAPESDIVIAVHSDEPYFAKTVSDKSGVYLYNFDSSVLEYGTHNAQSKAVIGNQLVSGFSAAVTFKVGTKNVYASGPRSCPAKGDVNGDCKVNLVDFSITAYWYKRALTGPFINTEKAKLSGDGKVDLKDFSIIAFNWTG
jgi:hypothetical protein